MAERPKVSSATVAEETRTNVIKIDGYSRRKELPETGKSTMSVPFMVGDHYWAMKYYPNGDYAAPAGYISLYLVLDSDDARDVKAKFTFSILDKGGEQGYMKTITEHVFPSKGSDYGFTEFIKHEDLQRPAHLRHDSFRIRCDVTVVKKIRSEGNHFIQVPPTNLHQHLGDLLKSMDGADVTFHVGGEKFLAHRSVLAARSSVFKAQLFGAMKESSDSSPIKIFDMKADVFKSFLRFLYTDSLLEVAQEGSNQGEGLEDVVMAGHLLVAADMYNIERLKLICERMLCSHIDPNMVANNLALAEQHSCLELKEACFEFLAFPFNLKAMIASDGYEHLKSSCPSVLKELLPPSRCISPPSKNYLSQFTLLLRPVCI